MSGVGGDDREQVVEVVGDAAGEVAEGVEPLGLAQLVVEAVCCCGDVAEDAFDRDRPAGRVGDEDGRCSIHSLPAVGWWPMMSGLARGSSQEVSNASRSSSSMIADEQRRVGVHVGWFMAGDRRDGRADVLHRRRSGAGGSGR